MTEKKRQRIVYFLSPLRFSAVNYFAFFILYVLCFVACPRGLFFICLFDDGLNSLFNPLDPKSAVECLNF